MPRLDAGRVDAEAAGEEREEGGTPAAARSNWRALLAVPRAPGSLAKDDRVVVSPTPAAATPARARSSSERESFWVRAQRLKSQSAATQTLLDEIWARGTAELNRLRQDYFADQGRPWQAEPTEAILDELFEDEDEVADEEPTVAEDVGMDEDDAGGAMAGASAGGDALGNAPSPEQGADADQDQAEGGQTEGCTESGGSSRQKSLRLFCPNGVRAPHCSSQCSG
jgi:hypothetical protein